MKKITNNKRINKINIITILISIFFLFGVFSTVIGSYNFIGKDNTKKTIELNEKSKEAIEQYLNEKIMKPNFNGKIYNSFKVLKADESNVYIWALIEELYKEENKAKLGSGMSVPMALKLQSSNGVIKVIGHKIPGDGSQYSEDVKRLFPKDIQNEILKFSSTNNIKELEKNINEKVAM